VTVEIPSEGGEEEGNDHEVTGTNNGYVNSEGEDDTLSNNEQSPSSQVGSETPSSTAKSMSIPLSLIALLSTLFILP